jgi:glycine cleavage system aminomethyltransferase T
MIDVFPVYSNGDRVGQVTSACYSPRLEKNIGFAMLPIELTEFGTQLVVETPQSGRVDAVVVRKPFIDPEKEVPKQEVAAGVGAKTTSDVES